MLFGVSGLLLLIHYLNILSGSRLLPFLSLVTLGPCPFPLLAQVAVMMTVEGWPVWLPLLFGGLGA